MRRRLRVGLAVVLGVLALTACEDTPDPDDDPGPVTLTFGVFGSAAELAPYETMVEAYNAKAVSVEVELLTWPSSDAMIGDVEAGGELPDVYMIARRNLTAVVESQRNTPLFDLLEARDVSYGDDFSQPAIEAMSADDDLQCMPSSVSPMVIYYNTDLIDFDLMRQRGLPAPDDELEGWTLEEFRAAAAFAARRGRASGVTITPTLRGIAPFVYSGGGTLFNDPASPTSLALSDGDSLSALTTTLDVLRDPTLTLGEAQLAEATPQTWFERGQLGMIEGFRDLTPELREVEGLDFDVMPMPQVGDPATVGDITGLCIAPGDHVQPAADFLVHAISDEGVKPVSKAGYVVPANLTVARSEAFLQSGQQPAHAGVFNASVDNMVLLPFVEDSEALNAAVDPLLDDMLNDPSFGDLGELTAQIDEASRPVLDPDYEPPPSEPSSD